MRLIVLLLAGIALGCGDPPPAAPAHTWREFGTTVSIEIHEGFFNSSATLTTTAGTVISKGTYPNPFAVGLPVTVRDDGAFARVGREIMRLRSE